MSFINNACRVFAIVAISAFIPLLTSCNQRTAESNPPGIPEQKKPPQAVQPASKPETDDPLRHPDEKHLRNIRQLTFGGRNAEAYFSFDEKKLIFQSTRPPYECDQMFIMNIDGSDQHLVSTGKGRTTCGFFLPGDKKIIFSTTHTHGDPCPPPPDKSKGYVWGVFGTYDIYSSNADGTDLRPLSVSDGYDAEAVVAPTGDRIVFTSSRDGDMEIYSMKLDGSDVRRITNEPGYDGGPVPSWDGKRIVFRAYHPTDPAEMAEYKELLAQQLVKPGKMHIYICDMDGSNKKQLTNEEGASFAPTFLPGDKKIVFASNMHAPTGRNFHLYIMNSDGTELKQVTFGGTFNGFPMFTRDGKKIVFCSDRNAKERYEYNVFIADWVD